MKKFFRNAVSEKRSIMFLCLLALGFAAFLEFSQSGFSRRTFMFYSIDKGILAAEDRRIASSQDRETNLRRYIEETLLGPMMPGLEPLFPRETKLVSSMLRGGTVYADFSEPALLPFSGNLDVFQGFLALNTGLRRNFPFVKDVKLFIGGNEIFSEEFNGIFQNSADNIKASLQVLP